MSIQTIRYRARYWYRRIIRTIGYCPDCWTPVNWTRYGKPICPECGR